MLHRGADGLFGQCLPDELRALPEKRNEGDEGKQREFVANVHLNS
jgi:hypothetical protein